MVPSVKGRWFETKDLNDEQKVVERACAVGMMAVGLADTRDFDKCNVAWIAVSERLIELSSKMGIKFRDQIVCRHDDGYSVKDTIEWLESKGC